MVAQLRRLMSSSRARTLRSECVARPLDRAGIGLAPSVFPSRHAGIMVSVWRRRTFPLQSTVSFANIPAVAMMQSIGDLPTYLARLKPIPSVEFGQLHCRFPWHSQRHLYPFDVLILRCRGSGALQHHGLLPCWYSCSAQLRRSRSPPERGRRQQEMRRRDSSATLCMFRSGSVKSMPTKRVVSIVVPMA